MTIALAVPLSSAQAAGFNCSASAGRFGVLGQAALEPVTANAGGSACTAENNTLTGPAASPTSPASVGAFVAATEIYSTEKGVLSTGGISELKVLSLPTLPITLPAVTIPDTVRNALKTTVDLTALKALITPVLDPLNVIRPTIPDSVAVDGSASADALLAAAKLPTVELLHVRGAIAYAVGVCKSGSPTVSGSSAVSGISVLGQDLPVGALVDKALSLDTTSIDPSTANIAAIDLGLPGPAAALIAATPALKTALDNAIATARTTIQTALDALPTITNPVPVSVKVVPGATTTSGLSVTQQALTVTVSIAGQKLVDAVVGEAKASAEGVDCSAPVTDPGTPTGATLQCSTRRLVLVDVLERGGRVKLFGVADPSLVGKSVSIVFGATGKTVAHAIVAKDGSFDTTAALPAKNVRDTNAARYTAVLGNDRSINLKLRRRMIMKSMTSKNGKVTIVGRVVLPLGRPRQPITLKQRVSCKGEKVVGRFMPKRDGSFRIVVDAPEGLGTAVYRMTTEVRNSPTGHAMFKTFTLPRAVELSR